MVLVYHYVYGQPIYVGFKYDFAQFWTAGRKKSKKIHLAFDVILFFPNPKLHVYSKLHNSNNLNSELRLSKQQFSISKYKILSLSIIETMNHKQIEPIFSTPAPNTYIVHILIGSDQ